MSSRSVPPNMHEGPLWAFTIPLQHRHFCTQRSLSTPLAALFTLYNTTYFDYYLCLHRQHLLHLFTAAPHYRWPSIAVHDTQSKRAGSCCTLTPISRASGLIIRHKSSTKASLSHISP